MLLHTVSGNPASSFFDTTLWTWKWVLPKLDVWETQTSEPQPSRVAKLPGLSKWPLATSLDSSLRQTPSGVSAAFNIFNWIHSLLEAFYIFSWSFSLSVSFINMLFAAMASHGPWQGALRSSTDCCGSDCDSIGLFRLDGSDDQNMTENWTDTPSSRTKLPDWLYPMQFQGHRPSTEQYAIHREAFIAANGFLS